ncbi:hypothetical protein [Prevotella sp.]|uniref:hypothetical protein n=1 Tax=Prevotella sp. TaxID=59823 RepID=UPI0027E31C45|nr:hypothetical protein [Prevotella sp.]
MKKIEIVKKANGVAAEVDDICSTIRDDKVLRIYLKNFGVKIVEILITLIN